MGHFVSDLFVRAYLQLLYMTFHVTSIALVEQEGLKGFMYYKGSIEKNKVKNKEIQEVIQYMQYNVDYCDICSNAMTQAD